MKTLTLALLGSALLVGVACSTPDSRARKNAAAVSTWPVEVQENVRSGKVDLGYSQDMVRVALGEPDRTSTRTTERGNAEVWIYFDKGPKFSFGVGMGSSRGSSGFGGGVTVGDDWRDEEVMRVIFEGGMVSAVERRR